MKKLLSTMASLILLLFFSNANATVIKGSKFKAGLWSGKAFLNDDPGEYAECYVFREFNNGIYLGFAFTDIGEFIIHLTNSIGTAFKDVDNSFQVASQVDRTPPIFLTAKN